MPAKTQLNSEFIFDDARFFKLPSTFHAIVSTNYGLNHVIKFEELLCVFQNVYESLLVNGLFMFGITVSLKLE